MGTQPEVGQLMIGLDTLAADDLTTLDNTQLRDQLQQLATAEHRLHAELIRRVDACDRRQLAGDDGFASTKTWLQALTRTSGRVAHRLVKTAQLLRQLPKLAEASQSGQVPAESVEQVVRLAAQVGGQRLAEVEPALTDAACELDPATFEVV